jgi:signal peptidase I
MILRWFLSPTVRHACTVRKHYRRMLAAQRDILSPQAAGAVQLKLNELGEAIAEGHSGRINVKAEELQFAAEKWIKPYPNAAWRENVEVLLVALAVAMGVRTFFLQPFKIPTGSMQPTLFGINSTPDFTRLMQAYDYFSKTGFSEEAKARLQAGVNRQLQMEKSLTIPSGWERVKEWFQGISYVHVVAPADGTVQVGPVTKFLIFNIKQTLSIGGVKETIWFPPDYGESDLQQRAGLFPGREYRKGEDVVKMRVSAGDHLFVDRLTYNFRRPERGEIIVFETAGIPEDMRDRYHIPANEFYIKRLVGLPGDKVQIGDDRHLIINGQRLDASTPHFENVYGFNPALPPSESQWSGHVNGTVAQEYHLSIGNLPEFPDQDTVYDVPSKSCLAMGDNTCDSLDSRFWGAIPEKYVIGKSFFVYWPLTGRFGLDDH